MDRSSATRSLPIQEEWAFTVGVLEGAMVLGAKAATFSAPEGVDSNKLVEEQRFKNVLVEFLNRSDFSVTKKIDAAVPQTTWTILFSQPGPVDVNLYNNLKAKLTLARFAKETSRSNVPLAADFRSDIKPLLKGIPQLADVDIDAADTLSKGSFGNPWIVTYTAAEGYQLGVDDRLFAADEAQTRVVVGPRTPDASKPGYFKQEVYVPAANISNLGSSIKSFVIYFGSVQVMGTPASVDSVTVVDGGSGYAVPPVVDFARGGGAGVDAVAVASLGVTAESFDVRRRYCSVF